MERKIDDRTILDKFAEDFCRVMEKYSKYIICSGFVSIAHGRSRGTEDIDMIIEKISKNKFIKLHKDLVKNRFVCIQSDDVDVLYDDYLGNKLSISYVRKSEGFFPPEMEVKFVKDELDEEQIMARRKFPLTGLDIYFSSIESNIAFKEEFLGTEKDFEDAKHLKVIYEGEFDGAEVERIKKRIIERKNNEKR